MQVHLFGKKIANDNGIVTSDMSIFFPNQNNRNMELERSIYI